MDPLVASIQSTIQAQWREISQLGVRLERVEQRESLMSNATSLTLSGDLAVNGGDITSTATTFNLLNATATTVNAFGAATAINVGAAGTAKLAIGTTSAKAVIEAYYGGITTGQAPATSGTTPNNPMGRFSNNRGVVLDIGGQYSSPYGIWLQVADQTDLSVEYPLLLQPNGSHVGIGTTTVNTWGSDYVAVRLGARAALWGSKTDGAAILSENLYTDGVNYKGIANAAATALIQESGALKLYTAPANGVDGTLTLTQRLLVDATGTKVTSGYSGGTVGALDDYDDAMVLHRGMSEGQAQALVDVGVLEQHGDVLMWDIERAFMLLGGGIYQTRAKVDSHESRISELERENRELRAQLARLN